MSDTTTVDVSVNAYEATKAYITDNDLYEHPIYATPSLQEMCRMHEERGTGPTPAGGPIMRDADSVGLLAELWRPFTPTGRMVRRVLADMERDDPEFLAKQIWYDPRAKTVSGVPRDRMLSSAAFALGVAVGLAAMISFMVVLFIYDASARPTPAEACAEVGGIYTDHGGGLFSPNWSCQHPPRFP